MRIDESVISYVVEHNALAEMQRAGVTRDDFEGEYRTVWNYMLRCKREHDEIPSREVLRARFPDIDLPRIKARDAGLLLSQLRQRRRYTMFIRALTEAARRTDNYEVVDEVIPELQAQLNALSTLGSGRDHMVDLFTPESTKLVMREYKRRRNGTIMGIPTGLHSIDEIGGLQAQQMVTVCGRPGKGKSWMNLLFVACAVMNGQKVILYPLEMTLFETAARLYSLFSQRMFGMQRVLRNYDITTGRASTVKLRRFLETLSEQFPGQLLVADVAALGDSYTNERIEAEVELYRPAMFWVDYITLMKAPTAGKGSDDWQQVKMLSNGIKNTAMRRGVVGGVSAQVNREAIRGGAFLPRVENIAYGDAIGQDADKVIVVNRNHQGLWYALVKHRGGPEIGKRCCKFDVDAGMLVERDSQPEYESDPDDSPRRRRSRGSSEDD